jgi:hypothetical protein
MLEQGYERVHTVTDYYDGPRKGIADLDGRPHLYESEWDDFADNYASTFRLSPVGEELFALAMESWRIWLRWETAFHRGQTAQDTHPALPEDRPRFLELEPLLEAELKINNANCVRARGEFRPFPTPEWIGVGSVPLQVKWTRR